MFFFRKKTLLIDCFTPVEERLNTQNQNSRLSLFLIGGKSYLKLTCLEMVFSQYPLCVSVRGLWTYTKEGLCYLLGAMRRLK